MFIMVLFLALSTPYINIYCLWLFLVQVINKNITLFVGSENSLKVALQILGRKFYKNTNKSSLYSQSLLIFIHKTPVVENHLTTGEIRELLRPRSTPTGNTVYVYMSSPLMYIMQIHGRKFRTLRLMKALWKMITYSLCYGI